MGLGNSKIEPGTNKLFRFNPYKACYEPTDRKIGIHEYIYPKFPLHILNRKVHNFMINIFTGLPAYTIEPGQAYMKYNNNEKRYQLILPKNNTNDEKEPAKYNILSKSFNSVYGIFNEPIRNIHYSTEFGAINPINPLFDDEDDFRIIDRGLLQSWKLEYYKNDPVHKDAISKLKPDDVYKYIKNLPYPAYDETTSSDLYVPLNKTDYWFDSALYVDNNEMHERVLGGLVFGGATLVWKSALTGVLITVCLIGLLIFVYSVAHENDTVVFDVSMSKLPTVIISAITVLLSIVGIIWLVK